jgi:hypothetical protein
VRVFVRVFDGVAVAACTGSSAMHHRRTSVSRITRRNVILRQGPGWTGWTHGSWRGRTLQKVRLSGWLAVYFRQKVLRGLVRIFLPVTPSPTSLCGMESHFR